MQALVSHREREICLAGLWVITGFEQRPLHGAEREPRRHRPTAPRKRLSVLVNAITSFSNRPLVYIF